MKILCAVIDCTAPALLICEHCTRRLCGGHYGAGSATFCKRCFHDLITAPDSASAAVSHEEPAFSRAPAALGGAGAGGEAPSPALHTHPVNRPCVTTTGSDPA